MKSKKAKGAARFLSEIRKPETTATARKIIEKYRICDSCLGRQFGRISTGMTNRERGRIIRKLLKEKTMDGKCEICSGLFQTGLDKWASEAIKKLKKIEYSSFMVGSRLSKELISKEEELWGLAGITHCEQLKTELNRELGKLIWGRTHKKVDELNPDVVVLLDTEKKSIELQVNPMFIYGEYQKLARGIPQTKWDMYKTSVEDIIAKPIMKATKGKSHAMHGAGREDIDARCLGWRPFVLEICEPVKRKINIKTMQSMVNRSKKAKVRHLRHSDKKEVTKTKAARHDKTYRLLVRFQNPLNSGDLEKLKGIVGMVRQRTPERVLHRRSDLLRKRMVKSISWKKVSNKKLELEIKGEAGLYVKELATGDGGRTNPNIAEILGNPAKVIELDVIKIHKTKENN